MTLFFQTLGGSNEDNMGAETFGPRLCASERASEGGSDGWRQAGKGELVKGFGKHEASVSRVQAV